MARNSPYPVFRNYNAAFAWAFMLVWMGGLVIYTRLAVEAGAPGASAPVPAGILLVFWIGGIAGCVYFFGQACVRAAVRNGALFVSEWKLLSPFRRRLSRFDLLDLPPPFEISHDTDSEGDPYFRLLIVTPDQRRICVAEGRSLPDMESLRERMLALWAAQG